MCEARMHDLSGSLQLRSTQSALIMQQRHILLSARVTRLLAVRHEAQRAHLNGSTRRQLQRVALICEVAVCRRAHALYLTGVHQAIMRRSCQASNMRQLPLLYSSLACVRPARMNKAPHGIQPEIAKLKADTLPVMLISAATRAGSGPSLKLCSVTCNKCVWHLSQL